MTLPSLHGVALARHARAVRTVVRAPRGGGGGSLRVLLVATTHAANDRADARADRRAFARVPADGAAHGAERRPARRAAQGVRRRRRRGDAGRRVEPSLIPRPAVAVIVIIVLLRRRLALGRVDVRIVGSGGDG